MSELERLFIKFLHNNCSESEAGKVIPWLETTEGKIFAEAYISNALAGFDNSVISVEQQDVVASLEKIKNSSHGQLIETPVHEINKISGKWYLVAASFLGLLLAAGYFYFSQGTVKNIEFTALSNARKVLILPDSSEVVLYENSTLTYSDEWDDNKPRKVWLKGSGYFSVKHTINNSPFTVYTTDSLNIEVLGTKFEVAATGQKSRVILEEGKVNVYINKHSIKKTQVLQPGEMFDYNETLQQLTNEKVDAPLLTFRSKNEIVLNQTTFKQLAELIQNTYGFTIVVPEEELWQQQFSGTLPSAALQETLNSLSKLIDMKYTLKNKEIEFFKN